MEDFAFDPVRVAGLGLLKPPPAMPQGLGHGQWGRLPRGLAALGGAPGGCKNWLLAFVSGAPRPNVSVAGPGFSYQKFINYCAARAGNSTTYFTFSNSRGTYVMAYEAVGGRRVVKVCADGMSITRAGGGRAPLTVTPRRVGLRGLGAIFSSSGPSTGLMFMTPTQAQLASTFSWSEIYPTSASGITFPNVAGIIKTAKSVLNHPGTVYAFSNPSQYTQAFNGYIYFGYVGGGMTTPGEPSGVALCRYHIDSSGQDHLGVCISETSTAAAPPAPAPSPAPPSGAITSTNSMSGIPIYTPPTGPAATPPPSPGLWWWNYQWIYQGGGGLPNAPPNGFYPPGTNLNATDTQGAIGQWVTHGENRYSWFPTGQLVQILGGDNNYYWVDSSVAANAQQPTAFAPPTQNVPPSALTGATGYWVNPIRGYYVWITTGTAASSYAWLWLLLGVGVLGGVAYYALD